MPLVRMLVSWGPATYKVADRFSNTLYFNVSGSVDDPDYGSLADAVRSAYAAQSWAGAAGVVLEVRAYDMRDAKPRPERSFKTSTGSTGTFPQVAPQVAVAISYYADRNLPRRRGRIFTGPWSQTDPRVSVAQRNSLVTLATALSNVGGLNVDWSVYSPTTDVEGHGETGHYRISNVWIDNSFDVIRSRKLPATDRTLLSING